MSRSSSEQRTPPRSVPSATQVASRVAASLLGGYAFVWGLVALGTVLGLSAGMPYADAQTLAYLIAFVVLVAAFCWAFAARSALRVWFVLAGGGAAMTAVAWFVARALA